MEAFIQEKLSCLSVILSRFLLESFAKCSCVTGIHIFIFVSLGVTRALVRPREYIMNLPELASHM